MNVYVEGNILIHLNEKPEQYAFSLSSQEEASPLPRLEGKAWYVFHIVHFRQMHSLNHCQNRRNSTVMLFKFLLGS